MKRFCIITNDHRDRNLAVTRSVTDYIISKGGSCSSYVVNGSTTWSDFDFRTITAEQLDADCIIVLGGDGTLVRASRNLAHLDVPLIGVNLGTLGYLCELDQSTIYSAIDKLFENQYECEERMMLMSESDATHELDTTYALNDIVIHRIGQSQIINLVLMVNGEYLTTYTADGIIISTPTGSTGYSMSAGGPIVDPKADLIVITPINSHAPTGRSIVVGADAKIELLLAKRRPEEDEEAEVCFDGDRFIYLKVGERIRIHKANASAKILKLDQLSFLQILRKKMQDFR